MRRLAFKQVWISFAGHIIEIWQFKLAYWTKL